MIERPLKNYPRGCPRKPDEPMCVGMARDRAENYLPGLWKGRLVGVRAYLYDDDDEVVGRVRREGRLSGEGMAYDCWDQPTYWGVVFPDNSMQYHDVRSIEVVDPNEKRHEIEKRVHPDDLYAALSGVPFESPKGTDQVNKGQQNEDKRSTK